MLDDIIEPQPLEPTNNIQQLNTQIFEQDELANDPAFQSLGSVAPEEAEAFPELDVEAPGVQMAKAPIKEQSLSNPYASADDEALKGIPSEPGTGLLDKVKTYHPVAAAMKYNPLTIAVTTAYGIKKQHDEKQAAETARMRAEDVKAYSPIDPETGEQIPTGPKATFEDKVKLTKAVGSDMAMHLNGENKGLAEVTSPLEFVGTGGVVAAKLAGRAGLAVFGAGAIPEFLATISAEEIAENHPVAGLLMSVAAGVGSGAAANKFLKGGALLNKAHLADAASVFNKSVKETELKLVDQHAKTFNNNYGYAEPVPRSARAVISGAEQGPQMPAVYGGPTSADIEVPNIVKNQARVQVERRVQEAVAEVSKQPALADVPIEAAEVSSIQALTRAVVEHNPSAKVAPIVKEHQVTSTPALPIDSSVKSQEAMTAAKSKWFGPSVVTDSPNKDHFNFVKQQLELHNTKVDGPMHNGKPGLKQNGIYGEERQQQYAIKSIQSHTAAAKAMLTSLVKTKTGLAGKELDDALVMELGRRQDSGQLGYNYVTDLKQAVDMSAAKAGIDSSHPDFGKLVEDTDAKLYRDYLSGVKDEAELIHKHGVATGTPKKEYIRSYEDVKYFEAPTGGAQASKTIEGVAPGHIPSLSPSQRLFKDGSGIQTIKYSQTSWDAVDNIVMHDGPTFSMSWELGAVKPPVAKALRPSPTVGTFDFSKINSPEEAVRALWQQWFKVLKTKKTKAPESKFFHYADAEPYMYDGTYTDAKGVKQPIRRIKESEVHESAKMLGWRDDMVQTINSFNKKDVSPDGRAKNYSLTRDEILQLVERRRNDDITSPGYWKSLDAKQDEYYARKAAGASSKELDTLAADLTKANYKAMNSAWQGYHKQVGEFIRGHQFTKLAAMKSTIKNRWANGILDEQGTLEHKVSDKMYYDVLGRLAVFRNQIGTDIKNHTGTVTEKHAKKLYMYAQDTFGGTNHIEMLNVANRSKARSNFRQAFSGTENFWHNADSHELSIRKMSEREGISYEDAEKLYVEQAMGSPEQADDMLLRAQADNLNLSDEEIELAADANFQKRLQQEAINDSMAQAGDDAGEGVIDAKSAALARDNEIANPEDLATDLAVAKIEDAFETDVYSKLYRSSLTHGEPGFNLLAINNLDDLLDMVSVPIKATKKFPNGMVSRLAKIHPEDDLGITTADDVSQDYINQMGSVALDLQKQTDKFAANLLQKPDDFLMGGLAFEKSVLLEGMVLRMMTHKSPSPSQILKLSQMDLSAIKASDLGGVKQASETALRLFGTTHDELDNVLSSSYKQTRELADMYLSLPDSQAKGKWVSQMSEFEDTLRLKELRSDLNDRRTNLVRKLKTMCK